MAAMEVFGAKKGGQIDVGNGDESKAVVAAKMHISGYGIEAKEI